jgi:drug/metabolite transporter (DMT)-like permease
MAKPYLPTHLYHLAGCPLPPSAAGASAMTTYYVSLLLLPMADAVTLFFLNPTLTAILVWLVRGEHLGWLGAAGCLSSFSGLLLLVHPPFLFGGHQDWGYARSMGVVAGLVSSCLCAAAFLCIRMIGKEEPALVVALWFHTATLVVSSLPLAVGWPQKAVVMSGREWGLLLGVAGTSFMGQLLMTRGFQLMPASRASSVNMTQVSTLLGDGMGGVVGGDPSPSAGLVEPISAVTSVVDHMEDHTTGCVKLT